MANYESCFITNQFRVTDEKKYEELCGLLDCCDSDIIYETYPDDKGALHVFAGHGSISWDDNEEFVRELQKILPEDGYFIYHEIGHEKLRYVASFVYVITKKNNDYYNFEEALMDSLTSLLGEKIDCLDMD